MSTLAGASLRSYGRGTQQLPASVPAGAIMIYNVANTTSYSPPANCVFYTEAVGKYIIGTGTNSEVGSNVAATGTSRVTLTTTTTGDHRGGLTSAMKYSYFNQGDSRTSNEQITNGDSGSSVDRGGHSHTSVSFDTTGAMSNTCSVPLIKSQAQLSKVPPNVVVFRKVRPVAASFGDYRPSGNGHYYGAESTGWQNQQGAGQGVGNTNSTGSHSHGVFAPYMYLYKSGAGGAQYPVSNGAHTHTASVGGLVATLRSKHLKAWTSSVETDVEYGMILMYSGSITRLPPGWRLCDGTLGTPDMVGYFIGYTSDEVHDGVISAQTEVLSANSCTLTTADVAHTHQWNNTPSSTGFASHSGYHGTYTWSHTHAVSTINTTLTTLTAFMPPCKKLAFIQYKGI
jgi:hypothetical protein